MSRGVSWLPIVFAISCAAGPGAPPPPVDAAPSTRDTAPSMPEVAGVDRAQAPKDTLPSDQTSASFDGRITEDLREERDAGVADVRVIDAMDAPKAWPPPGTLYLTKLETEAQFKQLAGAAPRAVVPFIIRRRANGETFPYPWDTHECVFESGPLHLEFLKQIDPDRAITLYFSDAKTANGSLIPGRISVVTTNQKPEVTVLFENFSGLIETNNAFPIDTAVAQILRERIGRCAPFATNVKFTMVCAGGLGFDCPLP